MSTITFDHTKSAIVVSMTFGDKPVTVVFKPELRQWFEAVSVLNVNGNQIKGDKRFHYIAAAERELQAWFIRRLKPLGTHVIVANLAERIELAFCLKLDRLNIESQRLLSPLGNDDLKLLKLMGQEIVDEHVRLSGDGRRNGHNPPDWNELKRCVLRKHWEEGAWLSERRDFYSSVLGTALGWRGNRVPRTQYERADKLRLGMLLAFTLQ
ncbi:hypothetical protein CL655_00780 [bacterium]|nr:hypothetical protein [bacterium]|tara:strand:- start:7525 stop:8154 length:630 start_codon:yes stop_codon:yes gene_type:complete